MVGDGNGPAVPLGAVLKAKTAAKFWALTRRPVVARATL
jgi:hypothetical protein